MTDIPSHSSSLNSLPLWARLRRVFSFSRPEGPRDYQETIEEVIEEVGEHFEEKGEAIRDEERIMLANILKLRHLSAYDVMVPRAGIIAVEINTGLPELLATMAEAGHSRLPVYRESLDDPAGLIHIKDLVAFRQDPSRFQLKNVIRPLGVVAPSMRVMDLLLDMRIKKSHMVLVVDEFGGIDGLITIEDLVEEIVGEIEDEHDVAEKPKLLEQTDGTLVADARCPIEDFEALLGPVLSEEEREEDLDTLGGLVFYLLDRIPARGELIEHPTSGLVFEVIGADPRRVKRLRIRNVAQLKKAVGTEDAA